MTEVQEGRVHITACRLVRLEATVEEQARDDGGLNSGFSRGW